MKNIKIWIAAAVVAIAVAVIGALAFTAAIEIDPRNADAYLGLADAYAGMGDLDAAIAALEEGYELTGDERLRDYIDALQGGAASSGTQTGTQTEPVALPFTAEDFTLAGASEA